MESGRIPVTIITGFLGSGKTTLINQIINKRYREKKFAIIENEFGEIGIDGALIMEAAENIFELSNGCICCSLNDGFYEVLVQLLEGSYHFDHLLVETTGIADPTTIVKAFVSSESIQSKFVIDSVICLADAINIEDLLEEEYEALAQVALSDIILLNKVDSVQVDYAVRLEKMIKQINPMARFYPVSYGNPEGIDILGLYAYSGREIRDSTYSFFPMGKTEIVKEQQLSLLTNTNVHHHKHDISAEGFSIPGNFDPGKFMLWMESFLYFNPTTIFRGKGVLSFKGKEERYIFQAVRDKFTLEPGELWNSEPRHSKLVFIGKKLQRDTLEANLFQLRSTENIKL